MLIPYSVKGLIWLTDEEKQDPVSVLQEFFNHYHLHESRQDLADCFRLAIITDNASYDTGRKRSDAIFFYEQVSKLIEASYLLKENNA